LAHSAGVKRDRCARARLDELCPAEQARVLRLLIERIDVATDGISVTLHAAGIRSLVAELARSRH
jgi:site-specific DNA recombinase